MLLFIDERYFYFLETLPPRERGLVVFDELDKAKSHILIQQMAAYFLGSETGKYRSSRIVPEPLFVHSELTTGIFIADLAAYVIGWAWRTQRMSAPARPELQGMCAKLHDMQFRGQKADPASDTSHALYGILYLDDLRPKSDRPQK